MLNELGTKALPSSLCSVPAIVSLLSQTLSQELGTQERQQLSATCCVMKWCDFGFWLMHEDQALSLGWETLGFARCCSCPELPPHPCVGLALSSFVFAPIVS